MGCGASLERDVNLENFIAINFENVKAQLRYTGRKYIDKHIRMKLIETYYGNISDNYILKKVWSKIKITHLKKY